LDGGRPGDQGEGLLGGDGGHQGVSGEGGEIVEKGSVRKPLVCYPLPR
jgi:hypothetical protein